MVTKVVMVAVMVIVVVALVSPRPASATSIFSAFSRGFEHQEEIQTTLVTEGSGWKSRAVPGRVWACTRQPRAANTTRTRATDQLATFLRLFAYLNGRNSRDERLPMGIPVSIEVRTGGGGGGGGGRELSACFFLPESVQNNPPTPTDPLVYLSHRPALTILTRQFGGFATDEGTWEHEARGLREVLTGQGQEIRDDLQYWNAYDPPYKFWNRRNEVWFVKA